MSSELQDVMMGWERKPQISDMKAARVDQFGGPVHIVQESIPEPEHDQVLIEIKACGMCHTDVHAIKGDWKVKPCLPLCPGHEGVGVIRKIGCDVFNFQVGDHAGVPWLYYSCGSCEYCICGWETLCLKQKNCGYTVPGCFRQYIVAPASHAIPIPKNMGFDQAAPILCAGVTSYKALKESEARPGQFICIIGAAGGLGHLAVQYGRAMGFRVIAMDVGPELADYCTTLGAEWFIDANRSEDSIVEEINQYTDGGCHGVIVIAPNISAYATGINICRRRGTMVCVSLPKDDSSLDIQRVVMRRITIRGSIVGTRADMREALDFASRGLVSCRITKEKLENVNKIMEQMLNNQVHGRVVLEI